MKRRGRVCVVAAALAILLVPGAGRDATGQSAGLSAQEVIAFSKRIQSCWLVPAELAKSPQPRVRIRISLEPDGSLSGDPIVVTGARRAVPDKLTQSVVRAVRACAPYNVLSREKYQIWKMVEVTFDTSTLLMGPERAATEADRRLREDVKRLERRTSPKRK